ncbi:unnamed protein product [Spodoptera exigua]|nr:unnamed protein product [Spodoptera exigua]
MSRWWMVVLLAGAAAAGGRLPRTSPPAPQTPPTSSSAPRLPQRNLTLASRSSVRNRYAMLRQRAGLASTPVGGDGAAPAPSAHTFDNNTIVENLNYVL